ncbi:fused DSP-PTPase phosphatase/NAD kinase-like protein [Celeribacter sp.]|uniref:fused DSP-PTPase phosphatase/NAD kinase-like protein n=1 Tax=Celeribacter sp. TaxID=1890673 RepID=UPI003A94B073
MTHHTDPPRTENPPRRRRVWRIIGRLALVSVVLFSSLIGYLAYLQLSGNYHAIVEGEVYRSAQPDYEMLERFAVEDGGKTVLNLRGIAPGSDWYDTERAAADELGLIHIDFPMSDRKVISPEVAEELIAIMRDAPKPLLVHCKAGADRTGLAGALYLIAHAGASEAHAERHLSLLYGHVGVPISAAWPMDLSWHAYEAHIGLNEG